MKETKIVIRDGYSDFIDAMKGYAILYVLLDHSMPLSLKQIVLFDLWGGMGVPIFLLIQVFHYFKNGLQSTCYVKFGKIIKRLFVPFIMAELIVVLVNAYRNNSIIDSFLECVRSGGYGSGEYYIWIYLQFMVLLPLTRFILSYTKGVITAFVFIAISVFWEFLCSILDVSDHLYKFLFFRYFFLIYLGSKWANQDIVLNMKYMVLSVISIAAILVFDLADRNFEPLFFDTSWKCCHWICYFYPFSLLVVILYFVHSHFCTEIQKLVQTIGRYSWQIFCSQLVVFSFMSTQVFSFIDNDTIQGVMYMICCMLLSIVPVLLVKMDKIWIIQK